MFNDKYGLTQAVLDGRKTMTRRLIPKVGDVNDINWGIGNNGKTMITIEALSLDGLMTEDIYPQYQVGDVVAVAQAYKELYPNADFRMVGDEFMTESVGWSNKMFVKANLMRHHIKITDIKVERLQDISDEDLEKEGVETRRYENSGNEYVFYHPNPYRNGNWGYVHYHSLQEASQSFFDNICGKGTWERNPWVFVYEFEL